MDETYLSNLYIRGNKNYSLIGSWIIDSLEKQSDDFKKCIDQIKCNKNSLNLNIRSDKLYGGGGQ